MTQKDALSRRDFLGSCTTAGAALACATPTVLAAPLLPARTFERTRLLNEQGLPLRCGDLTAKNEYIFHYPFRSTPCFLIDLDEALPGGRDLQTKDGKHYHSLAGVGPKKSVVAFSAICAHKLTHPSKVVSFIGYREYPVGFLNRKTETIERRTGVIQCCSEHSIYDPTEGANVVSGPAPQPLAAIALEEDDNGLFATGVYGGDLFDAYFERFGDRLMLEHRSDQYADPVGDTSRVVDGQSFTRNRIRCT